MHASFQSAPLWFTSSFIIALWCMLIHYSSPPNPHSTQMRSLSCSSFMCHLFRLLASHRSLAGSDLCFVLLESHKPRFLPKMCNIYQVYDKADMRDAFGHHHRFLECVLSMNRAKGKSTTGGSKQDTEASKQDREAHIHEAKSDMA